jgi:intracellular sulfur oxidation DsrE/DsrF family protein
LTPWLEIHDVQRDSRYTRLRVAANSRIIAAGFRLRRFDLLGTPNWFALATAGATERKFQSSTNDTNPTRRRLAMTSNTFGRRKALLATAAVGAATFASTAKAAGRAEKEGPVKVVYHVTQGDAQASRCLGNVRNHLSTDPTAKIVVVGNGAGIDFMLNDAVDGKGAGFSGLVGGLASQGVSFRVCNNTLTNRKIPKERVLLDATIVPSGVAEATNLQYREGYAYICP